MNLFIAFSPSQPFNPAFSDSLLAIKSAEPDLAERCRTSKSHEQHLEVFVPVPGQCLRRMIGPGDLQVFAGHHVNMAGCPTQLEKQQCLYLLLGDTSDSLEAAPTAFLACWSWNAGRIESTVNGFICIFRHFPGSKLPEASRRALRCAAVAPVAGLCRISGKPVRCGSQLPLQPVLLLCIRLLHGPKLLSQHTCYHQLKHARQLFVYRSYRPESNDLCDP